MIKGNENKLITWLLNKEEKKVFEVKAYIQAINNVSLTFQNSEKQPKKVEKSDK